MEREMMMTTTFRLTAEVWSLLRRLAELERASDGGVGRASSSAVVAKLVRAEATAKKLLPPAGK